MAVSFQHPFQCVRLVERQHAGLANLLVASAGSSLYSYAAETGQRIAIWPQDVNQSSIGAETSSEAQGPPEKKQKVSSSAAEANGQSKTAWSNIPILVVSSNGEYVVALTAEDKCIRVFQLKEDGTFLQLSERVMPKRPCSIALGQNDSTILCGDKFGDVYSLPLIPNEEAYVAAKNLRNAKLGYPAATNLTVHTKGNLASLEQQKKQHAQNEANADDKATLNFEHQLLLGHVSLLTDLAFVSLPTESSPGKKRTYILTADRDEHIRVSRGPPQAYVIENYCFGHTSFISKLCIPQWAPEYLISGGGDNYLLVWQWSQGRVVQTVSLVDPASENSEIAVRSICAASLSNPGSSEPLKTILVAIEGSSQIKCFSVESDGTMKAQESIQASGNVLDVASNEKEGTIVVSVDSVREAGSTEEWRSSPSSTLIESYRAKAGTEGLKWKSVNESAVANINNGGTSNIPVTTELKERKELNSSLYNLGNLRKKEWGDE